MGATRGGEKHGGRRGDTVRRSPSSHRVVPDELDSSRERLGGWLDVSSVPYPGGNRRGVMGLTGEPLIARAIPIVAFGRRYQRCRHDDRAPPPYQVWNALSDPRAWRLSGLRKLEFRAVPEPETRARRIVSIASRFGRGRCPRLGGLAVGNFRGDRAPVSPQRLRSRDAQRDLRASVADRDSVAASALCSHRRPDPDCASRAPATARA